MFTFWFTYDSNSDSFYNLIVCILIIFSIRFKEFSKSFKFSLLEVIKIKVQKIAIKKFMIIKILLLSILRKTKLNTIIINKDLNKTWYLKVDIIEREWIIRPFSGIFEGPKYLYPLTVGILWRLGICFFADPAKLLHKLFLDDNNNTSFFVKQL